MVLLRNKSIKGGQFLSARWSPEGRRYLRKNGKSLGKLTFLNLKDGKVKIVTPQKSAKVICEVKKAKTSLGSFKNLNLDMKFQ